LRNIKLVIQYEGTNYRGWQRQADGPTIQQALEEAVRALTGTHSAVVGSGRTDAGVHALGQVANFHTDSPLPCERIVHGLNFHLPRDIGVVDAVEVPASFHARQSAVSKVYAYTIHHAGTRPVLERRTRWFVRGELDWQAVEKAGACFVGTHDFAAFCTEADLSRNLVRTVSSLEVVVEPPVVRIVVEADGFLYNMVRAIVGTLVQVGKGRLAPDDVPAILASRDRRRAGPTAPACGLCLLEVRYS